jgi:23S rRNA (guanosine2251-2'-O)-methyltransferase
MALDQLEGRNPVIEALTRGRRRVVRVWLDQGARPDPRVERLLALCAEKGVPVARASRQKLDELAEGRVHQGVVAQAEPLPELTARQLLDQAFNKEGPPLIVLADQIQYEQNLGAILRTALGFGVDGVVVPTRRGAPLGPVVQRVAMGGAEAVPVIHEGLFSALKPIKAAGIPVVGADMGGVPLTEARLGGALALVLGGEGRGL